MPRAFSDIEREVIKKRLQKAAVESMIKYDVRRIIVDCLVKGANIPKGTFYNRLLPIKKKAFMFR